MNGEMEKTVQHGVFVFRWLLAPMYLGLALMLIVLLIQFVRDFSRILPELFQLSALNALPAVLSLAIVLLAGNAVLLVLQTGYQLFAPNLQAEVEPNAGRGRLDFNRLRKNLLSISIALALLLILKTLLEMAAEATAHTLQTLWPLVSILGLFAGCCPDLGGRVLVHVTGAQTAGGDRLGQIVIPPSG